MFTEVHCVVSGKVQGIGYRDFVRIIASQHGIVGWVKNKEDGTVELVAQETPDTLKEFISELYGSHALARVDSIAVDWRTPETNLDDFVVIF